MLLGCGGGGAPPDAMPDPLEGLAACTTSLTDAVSEATLQAPASGSDAYAPPAADVVTALRDSLTAALSGDAVAAAASASDAGYSVCRDGDVARWSPPPASGRAFGRYVSSERDRSSLAHRIRSSRAGLAPRPWRCSSSCPGPG